MKTPPVIIRELNQLKREDWQKVLKLVQAEYPNHGFKLNYLKWLYAGSPAQEKSKIYLAESVENEEVVALYAAIALPFCRNGEQETTFRYQDAITAPAFRGQGIMRQLVDACDQNTLSANIKIGFPNPFSRNALEQRGWQATPAYHLVSRTLEARHSKPPLPQTLPLPPYLNFDRLWQAYKPTAGNFSLWKDAAYLHWRYALHPAHSYLFATVSHQEELRGLGVFKFYDESPLLRKIHLTELITLDWTAAESIIALGIETAQEYQANEFSFWAPVPFFLHQEFFDILTPLQLKIQTEAGYIRIYSKDEAAYSPFNWLCFMGDSDVF